MDIITDLIDSILFAVGFKTIDAENPLERKHATYALMSGAAVGWVGGIYRAKSKPTVNVLGV